MSTTDDDLYALAEPEPEPDPLPPPKRRPLPPLPGNAPQPAPLTSHRAIPVGAKSAVERALEAREDEAQPSRFRDILLPAGLLAVGLVGQVLGWWEIAGTPGDATAMIAVALTLQLFVFLPLALLSVATIAKWFELGLGTLPGVLFKLLALMVGTGGIADVFFMLVVTLQDFEPSTVVAGYGIYLLLVGVPLLILLELSIFEMALAVLMLFLPRMAAVVTAALLYEEMFA